MGEATVAPAHAVGTEASATGTGDVVELGKDGAFDLESSPPTTTVRQLLFLFCVEILKDELRGQRQSANVMSCQVSAFGHVVLELSERAMEECR